MRQIDRDRNGGFTLIELLIVVVLGAVIVGATYQILITNSRTYTVSSQEVQQQQTLRAAMDVLFGELREISAAEGDLITMGSDTIVIRSARSFGVTCGLRYSGSYVDLRVKRVGDWFEIGDSVFVFADNDSTDYNDDAWLTGTVSALDTTQTCSGSDQAQDLRIQGVNGADTVRSGAPVRSFEHNLYSLQTADGVGYLARKVGSSSSWQVLVGPLATNAQGGMDLEYFDENGVVTATAAEVARIRVTLRTRSQAVDQQGNLVADSLITDVFVRN
jgi:prepilin-type N-terminal cleavage/methylation domain-containing protein